MTIPRFVTPLVLAASLMAAPAFAADDDPYDIKDTVKKTYKVEPGGTLEIDMDRGNVEIRVGDGDEVRIVVERILSVESKEEAKRMLEAHRLDLNQKGDRVLIHSRVSKDRLGWKDWRKSDRFKIRVVVEVPEEYDLDLTTGAGNVSVEDLFGELVVKSGAGNIEMGNVGGEVEIASGSGNVLVGEVDGSVEVITGAGNVELGEVYGTMSAVTGAGNITASITRQPEDDSRLASGAGNVTVFLSGNVGVDVDAVAKVGTCSTDFPLRIEGKWMSKSFAGVINGGGPELHLRSGVGNVVLRRLD